jgi:uncharacterized membrane protein YgcG
MWGEILIGAGISV